MSANLIAAAGVVGALALCETILPWAFAALRRWRESGTSCDDSNETLPQSATLSLAQGDTKDIRLVFGVRPRIPKELCARSVSSLRQSENESILNEKANEEAQRMWDESRRMRHRFKPDWDEDWNYLSRVCGAARLGHLEAMVKLGDYAYRRGKIVEAYYWTALAELKGANGLDVALREMKTRWLSEGCPKEYENVYGWFSETQGSFARALLRIRCAVNAPLARERMKELAERGLAEAQLFLRKGNR